MTLLHDPPNYYVRITSDEIMKRFYSLSLGAFEKLKRSDNFTLSVRPSVRWAPTRRIFMEFDITIFRKRAPTRRIFMEFDITIFRKRAPTRRIFMEFYITIFRKRAPTRRIFMEFGIFFGNGLLLDGFSWNLI